MSKKSKPIRATVKEEKRGILTPGYGPVYVVINEDGHEIDRFDNKKEAFDRAKEYNRTGS